MEKIIIIKKEKLKKKKSFELRGLLGNEPPFSSINVSLLQTPTFWLVPHCALTRLHR